MTEHDTSKTTDTGIRWLMLIHQLPAKPAYLRVKIWRRLQALGAVAVKNAVNVLPANEQTQEDFEWLLQEIIAGGGDALIVDAQLIDGLTDHEIKELFNRERDTSYDALAEEIRTLNAALNNNASIEPGNANTQLKRLRKRLREIIDVDFFGANSREPTESLLLELETQMIEENSMTPTKSAAR